MSFVNDEWTVEVNGPKGKKIVCLSNEQVEFFTGVVDPYATALWLAYCDLWTKGVVPYATEEDAEDKDPDAEVWRYLDSGL